MTPRSAATTAIGHSLRTLALALLGITSPAGAQQIGAVVAGTVRDDQGQPVAQAQVVVGALGRSTVSDATGRFTLRALSAGRHELHVARIGHVPVRRVVHLAAGDTVSLDVTLPRTALALPTVQVTGTGRERDPLAVAQATTHLGGDALQRELASTVAHTLRAQPGIAMRTMGPAAAMPVMRGLTGDRILILQDGQRSADLAGSADDHGLTIDPLVVERVEVIRGPATLLYGNNASGGVVNVISRDVPAHVPARAEWAAALQSESVQPGASASLLTTLPLHRRWALTLRGSGRSTGDLRIPHDPALGRRLEHTAARSWSGAAGLGYLGDRVEGGAALQWYDFGYGLPVAPGSDPVSLRGRRREARGEADVSLPSRVLPSLRLSGTVQDYAHDEVDERAELVAQTFVLDTRTANLTLRQGAIGPIEEGAWGASLLHKDYAASGPAALTPPAASLGAGVFGFQAVSLGRPTLELGLRLDDYRIASRASATFGAGRSRRYRALSGSAGLRVPLSDAATVALSVARSFRAPTVEELFSGAAHAGTGAVEFGSPNLQAEHGVALDGVLRVRSTRWNGQFAVYRHDIANYVHLAARGDTVVSGVRLPVLAYAQRRAVLQGAEGSLEWAATPTVVVGVTGDYLHAELADGTPLSFMPPPRLGLLARWDNGTVAVGGDLHHELRQDRVGAADERPTPAHTIVRLHAAVRFRAAGQRHTLSLRAENLTNALHREATSRIKDFAPGPGRNLALTWRVGW